MGWKVFDIRYTMERWCGGLFSARKVIGFTRLSSSWQSVRPANNEFPPGCERNWDINKGCWACKRYDSMHACQPSSTVLIPAESKARCSEISCPGLCRLHTPRYGISRVWDLQRRKQTRFHPSTSDRLGSVVSQYPCPNEHTGRLLT